MWVADRQLAQDERVDEREGRRARADREPERHDRGRRHDRVPAQEAEAEPEVAPQRLDPRQEFDVAARFAQEQAVAELPRRLCERGLTGEALGHEFVGACFDVKALLVFQISIELGRPHDVGES